MAVYSSGSAVVVPARGVDPDEENRPVNSGLVDAFALLAILTEIDERGSKPRSYSAEAFATSGRVIAAVEHELINADELRNLDGIGVKSLGLAQEYLDTGRMARLEDLLARYSDFRAAYETFRTVHGIGPRKAAALYQSGFRTLADLRIHGHDVLTNAQRLGLAWYDHINLPVYRYEIDEISDDLTNAWTVFLAQGLNLVIAGSYRRGEAIMHDIDVLVSLPANSTIRLTELVDSLGPLFIPARLALGTTKFMGLVKRNELRNAHRLDIRLIPASQFPYALLYFTGSKSFNKLVRSRALERGFTLNEYGLYHRDPQGRLYGDSHAAADEYAVLAFLGIRPFSPAERHTGLTSLE